MVGISWDGLRSIPGVQAAKYGGIGPKYYTPYSFLGGYEMLRTIPIMAFGGVIPSFLLSKGTNNAFSLGLKVY